MAKQPLRNCFPDESASKLRAGQHSSVTDSSAQDRHDVLLGHAGWTDGKASDGRDKFGRGLLITITVISQHGFYIIYTYLNCSLSVDVACPSSGYLPPSFYAITLWSLYFLEFEIAYQLPS